MVRTQGGTSSLRTTAFQTLGHRGSSRSSQTKKKSSSIVATPLASVAAESSLAWPISTTLTYAIPTEAPLIIDEVTGAIVSYVAQYILGFDYYSPSPPSSKAPPSADSLGRRTRRWTDRILLSSSPQRSPIPTFGCSYAVGEFRVKEEEERPREHRLGHLMEHRGWTWDWCGNLRWKCWYCNPHTEEKQQEEVEDYTSHKTTRSSANHVDTQLEVQ